MKKGSITVFSALCMSFVFSALFVLLEAARFYGLSQYADWKGRQGVECVAAEYQPYLWEEFHLLMLDGGYSTDFFEIGNVTGRMKEKLDENLNQKNFGWQFPDMNLFQIFILQRLQNTFQLSFLRQCDLNLRKIRNLLIFRL